MSEQTPKEMAVNAIEEAAREKAKSLALKNLDEIPQQLGNLSGQDALTVQGSITSYQVNGGTPTILFFRNCLNGFASRNWLSYKTKIFMHQRK